MTLLDFKKHGDASYSASDTLDSLWATAFSLGRIDVETDYSTKAFVVEIRFVRQPSGSNIRATGKNTDIREAFNLAIQEAISLGARS